MAQTPKFIGRFPIIDTLGIGGMGVVYLGKDPDIGRKVAIKVLHATDDESALERFKNEARTIGEISHPNIVMLLEYGIDDNKPYLVMEYLPGIPLEEWIKKTHLLSEYISILLDLCNAIQTAHDKGILHRDLKPGNIQILPSGQAKLLDFGIATSHDSGLTASGFFIGTPKYLAPEILQDTTHTKSSDCYSLGLLAYTMFCGYNPFSADNFEATMTKLLTKIPTSLHLLNPDIPIELSKTIDKYLIKDHKLRPSTPKNLQLVLELVNSPKIAKKQITLVHNKESIQSQETTLLANNQKSHKKLLKVLTLISIVTIGIVAVLFFRGNLSQYDSVTLEKTVKQQTENQKQDKDKGNIVGLTEIKKQKTDPTIDKIHASNVTVKTPVQDKNKEPTIDNNLDKKIIEVNNTDDKKKPQSSPSDKIKTQEIPKNIAIDKPKETIKETTKKKAIVNNQKQTDNKPIEIISNKVIEPQELIEETDNIPIFKLPDLNLASRKIKLTASDTRIPRGKTKKIKINVPDNILINNFNVMRGLSEFKQVEIKNIQKLESGQIQLTLYAKSNATMGDFSLVGIYKNKKTQPLLMEITL